MGEEGVEIVGDQSGLSLFFGWRLEVICETLIGEALLSKTTKIVCDPLRARGNDHTNATPR